VLFFSIAIEVQRNESSPAPFADGELSMARDRSMSLDRQTKLELLLSVIGTIVLVAFAAFFLVDR
jgi:hypothetical protein